MIITRRGDIVLLSVIILLVIVGSTHQTVYSCNASVSCGCSTNSATVARIVGGESATAATWGWAVSISIGGIYLCGGSIISNSWVVTAAHCVTGYTASRITIYAGSTHRFSGTQSRIGSQLIVHPSYNPTTYVNDIALLRLVSPLDMSDPYVSTICLPSVSSAILSAGEWPAANTAVVAVGWGTLSEGGSLPSTLQQVTVQTVDYRASTCAPSINDWHVQLCAGVSGGGKDTCQGDSGGPLMMFTSSQQWLLVGLTSNGVGCARATDSGLYTRVAYFQSWINSYTNGSVSTLTSSVSTTLSSSIRTTTVSASIRTTTLSASIRTTTLSTSIRTTTLNITSSAMHLHANTVRTAICNVFGVVLFNFLVTYFY